MGLSWRKSTRIAKGVKLNTSLRSIGLSAGGRGFGISANTRRKTRARVSVPGTGLSYSWNLFGSSRRKGRNSGANPVLTWAIIWILIACFTPVTAGWGFAGFLACVFLTAGRR